MGGLASGIGFSRGRGVVGGGRLRTTPSAELVISQVVRSWLMRTWAASRAVEARVSSVGFRGKGFGSEQRRFPRSKV